MLHLPTGGTRIDRSGLGAGTRLGPFGELSADLECVHGTAPGDARPQPGCPGWMRCTQPLGTPDLMGVLRTAQEAITVVTQDSLLTLARDRGDCGIVRTDIERAFSVTADRAKEAIGEAINNRTLVMLGAGRGTHYVAVEYIGAVDAAALANEPVETTDPIEAAIYALDERITDRITRWGEIQDEIIAIETRAAQLLAEQNEVREQQNQLQQARDTLDNLRVTA